jgi:hypothetical protein
MEVEIVAAGHRPDDVEHLPRALPEWFGIEQSIVSYADAASTFYLVQAS